ncbi:hypothetical protein HELRODRAFT_171748 [Helobdella robusta]|uniref:HTH CENPB-type domain-containing protein n=1 Tax=Helobdella robusta TaxID=6412 RepID=T1F4L6_HELRO|nr:hypothetical protein HELRODRAFT_171748 [Helobdella robusta]ESO05360.1 hypothetical protein HELRODRAFT_171748 [Helobdella robusta]
MVRSQQRTTNRGSTSSDMMLVAVKEVLDGKTSLRAISRKHNIDHATLIRYCKKYNNALNSALSTFRVGYSQLRKVFTDDEECLLEKYIKKAAALYYGLNPREVRILAYQFATTNDKVVSRNWKIDEKAGADWFSAFIKRHPHLSIRVPESTCRDQQKSNVTPEMIRPFKKTGPRKTSTGNRKKGKTQILTDTPVKAELEACQQARESKTINKKRKKILFDRNQQISRKTNKVSEKQKKSKNNIPIITSDDNTPCHLCGILANVPPFENLKECPSCKEWFHERCCLEDSNLC